MMESRIQVMRIFGLLVLPILITLWVLAMVALSLRTDFFSHYPFTGNSSADTGFGIVVWYAIFLPSFLLVDFLRSRLMKVFAPKGTPPPA